MTTGLEARAPSNSSAVAFSWSTSNKRGIVEGRRKKEKKKKRKKKQYNRGYREAREEGGASYNGSIFLARFFRRRGPKSRLSDKALSSDLGALFLFAQFSPWKPSSPSAFVVGVLLPTMDIGQYGLLTKIPILNIDLLDGANLKLLLDLAMIPVAALLFGLFIQAATRTSAMWYGIIFSCACCGASLIFC
jgi:hypothetical protein